MDYLITMENGSKALAHYGVLGMKWGKWNDETKARYASAGNGTYFKKAKRGDEYARSVTDLRRAYNANQPKGKQIAKNILLAPGGAHAYNTARSRGLSRADAVQATMGGVFYAQGVKRKQRKLESTDPMVSKAAKERSDYTQYESLGKSLGKLAAFGYAGSNTYNSIKARTKSTGKAAVAATVTRALSIGATAVVGSGTEMAVAGAAGAMLRRNGNKEQTRSNDFVRKNAENAKAVNQSIKEEREKRKRQK